MSRVLLIDVGNSFVKAAYAEKSIIVKKIRIATDVSCLAQLVNFALEGRCSKAVCCCVVPEFCLRLEQAFKKEGMRIFFCGKHIKIPVKSKYKGMPGQDRLLNVYTAWRINPDIRCVIDIGTALTIDFISKRGEFKGGFIFAGSKIVAQGIFDYTKIAHFSVKPQSSKKYPGKNTRDCINRGIGLGYSFLVKGFLDYYLKQGEYALITGGGAGILNKKICQPALWQQDLAIKGLHLLAKEAKILQ